MNQAIKIQTSEQQVKEMQQNYPDILKNSMISTTSEVVELINYLDNQKTIAGADIEILNKQKAVLHSILSQRIKLTAHVLGLTDATHVFIPNNTEIIVDKSIIKTEEQDNQERVVEQPKEKEAKVIQMTPKVPNQFFKGYQRKRIFGTDYELPIDIQKIIGDCDTESKIDEIAMKLIDLNQVEDALNLSIDLFERLNLKSQEEVEKRFLHEILPWAKGIQVKPFDSYQNITLLFWNQHLNEIANTKKKVKELTEKALNEMQNGKISIVTANTINTELPNEAAQIFASIAESLKVELKFEQPYKVEETTESTSTIAINLDVLKAECITMLSSGTNMDDVRKHFQTEITTVTDLDDKSKKSWGKYWGEIVKEFKSKPAEPKSEVAPEISDEDKEKIVAAAEEAAIKGESEFITPEKAEEQVKSLLIARKAGDKVLNVLNTAREIFKKARIKDMKAIYKKLEAEVEAIEIKPEEAPDIRLFKQFNVEQKDPSIWESAKLCKNIEEYKSLLRDLVFSKNMWLFAANLVEQYDNFDELKNLSNVEKATWFKEVIKDRPQPAKETKETESVVENNNDDVDFSLIATETNTGRIKQLVSSFLLNPKDTRSFEEKVTDVTNIVRKNNKYKRARPSDTDNFIKNVIKNNPKLKELKD